MAIALVRHGETNWNRDGLLQGISDIPLNETGFEQARTAGFELSKRSWDLVVSSPLTRARQTAEIVAGLCRTPFGGSFSQLVERDFGPFEGKRGDDVLVDWPDLDGPGMEPVADVGARGQRALVEIVDRHPDMDIVVVCHSFLITHTLRSFGRDAPHHIPNGAIYLL